MDANRPSQVFDQYYYAHDCGHPYQRDEEWMAVFGHIAQRIMRDIQPGSVLDAGCAWGFLVEKLRKIGIQAWGVDVSDYAIQNVAPEVKPFCWCGSITRPFPQKFDLIVCIEVLEHLPKSEAEVAIENLCQHTDDILVSSSPFDYKESTHINVQPPEYWAEQFAHQGFFRDVDFDASFISPWAVRFRRSSKTQHETVRDYERKYWLLWKENTDLRTSVQDMKEEAANKELVIKGLDDHLRGILESQSWQVIHKLQAIRLFFVPLGSGRERALVNFFRRVARRLDQKPPITDPYMLWLAENEPGPVELAAQHQAILEFGQKPTISIITPVYNPSIGVLHETIASVLAQTYPDWELCLADGGSKEEVVETLKNAAGSDDRIHLKFLDQNRGISANTNSALEMAKGEFILFLDHDDLLAPNTLYEVVQAIRAHPEVDYIYFDEDKVDERGNIRLSPFFKPDWSPEMLLATNYLTHPVIRKALFDEVGGFDPEFDGTQDWDLALRCVENTNQIVHIPKILYHWRQVSGSTSADFNAKPWVFERQLKAVCNHLDRIGLQSPRAEFASLGIVRARWQVRPNKVSIVIPTRDHVDDLKKCVDSLLAQKTELEYEIILVDNASQEPETLTYYESLKAEPRVKWIEYSEPFNYSRANNLGAGQADGDLLLFMNNDVTAMVPDAIEEMAQWAQQPEIGVVGTKLLYPDGTIQHAGLIMGLGGHVDHIFCHAPDQSWGIFGSTDWYRDYSALTAACFMLRHPLFDQIGGFDEEYKLVYSDVELCLRVFNAGYRNIYTPFARMTHHEGKTRMRKYPQEDMQRGYEHFIEMISAGDPYFNPNLSYAAQIPTLKPANEESRLIRLRRIVELSARMVGK
jgi:GT2 family glycosyltransferase